MIPQVNISELHDAIKATLEAAFPAIPVDCYTRPATVPTPSIFFELETFEPTTSPDMGNEQIEVNFRFSAEVVTTYKTGGKLAARTLAAAVASFVQRQRWGQPVTPARVTSALPEHFHSENPSFESWSVKWIQSGALGADFWNQEGAAISEGFAGQEGKNFLGNASEYMEVFPVFNDAAEPDQTNITLS